MKPKITKIIPIALALIIIAVIIAAIVTVARSVISPSQSTSNTSTSYVGREALLDSAADSSVKMVVRGNIVANETFKTYQITVTPNSRTLSVDSGYLDNFQNIYVLVNNIPAYEQFVHALDKANLIKGAQLTGDDNDLRGICATGIVYDFQIISGSELQKNVWTSTCTGSKGSLNASVEQVSNLFYAQISGSKQIISGLWQ